MRLNVVQLILLNQSWYFMEEAYPLSTLKGLSSLFKGGSLEARQELEFLLMETKKHSTWSTLHLISLCNIYRFKSISKRRGKLAMQKSPDSHHSSNISFGLQWFFLANQNLFSQMNINNTNTNTAPDCQTLLHGNIKTWTKMEFF